MGLHLFFLPRRSQRFGIFLETLARPPMPRHAADVATTVEALPTKNWYGSPACYKQNFFSGSLEYFLQTKVCTLKIRHTIFFFDQWYL